MEFSNAERYLFETSYNPDVRKIDVDTLTCLYGNMLIGFQDWKIAESWYPDARKLCAFLAKRYNRRLEEVVAIMAVYSMRTSWKDNRKRLIRYISTGEHRGSMMQYGKIFDIEHAQSEEEIAAILNGPKITRFYWSILYPLSCMFAVVDSWMIQPLGIAYSQLRGLYGTGETLYSRIEQALQVVAETLGKPVSVVQAAIWYVIRKAWY